MRHSVDSLRRIEDGIRELGRVAIKGVVTEAGVFTVLTYHDVALHPEKKNKQSKSPRLAETTKKMARGSVGERCIPISEL